MKLRGRIVDGAPVVYASVRNRRLCLARRGEIPLIVDTGFDGTMVLPASVIHRLRCEFIGVDTFTLATGVNVELPMYLGAVQIASRRITTLFVVGDALIGMELLRRICSNVHLDLNANAIELSGDAARAA